MSTISNLFLIISCVAALIFAKRRRSYLPLPPGPTKWPVIGTIKLHSGSPWIEYSRLSKDLGSDIIHLNVLGTSTVVLSSWEAASELLGRRSAHYSSRHVATMANELMGWDAILTFLPYGEDWRIHRRVFWQEFGPLSTSKHVPTQIKYGRILLKRLLDEPEDFLQHVRYSLSATIVSITYGFEIKEKNDPHVERSDRAHRHLSAVGLPGTYIVDYFPLLKYLPQWMPFTRFLEYAREARADLEAMIEAPFNRAAKLVSEGNLVPSFVARMLTETERDTKAAQLDTRILQNVASSAYSGGSETTSSTLSFFFAAMVLFPEAQMKAQAELDSHLDSRLPLLEDRPYLPYIYAVMLETLRWQPILPLGVAHLSIIEDEYKGYRIPKNSTVYCNSWAILHDEAHFPNHELFDPGRFVKGGKIDPHLEEIIQTCFGFGRRICPGRFMAQNSLWLYIASILATFDISKTPDTDIQFSLAFLSRVEPFKCSIKPRSKAAEELIRDANFMLDGSSGY